MQFTLLCRRYSLGLVLLVLLPGNDKNLPASINPDVKVNGTWDARFKGKVEGKGTSQDDSIVMQLKQNGAIVKGTLRFSGLDVALPMTGKVAGTTFTYSAKASVGPNCAATLVGEVTVDEDAGRFAGSQTQANCEGTAVGEVTAVRR